MKTFIFKEKDTKKPIQVSIPPKILKGRTKSQQIGIAKSMIADRMQNNFIYEHYDFYKVK